MENSRIINILAAIKAKQAYNELTYSRAEAILKAIANSTAYSEAAQSRYEELLLAIKNGTTTTLSPQTRLETILVAIANGTLDEYLTGKNLFDVSKAEIDGVKNETEVIAWAEECFDNDFVLKTLKSNTNYTISYNVKCVAVPTHDAEYSGSYGFMLYNGNISPSIPLMAEYKYLEEGEEIQVVKTFTTPSDLTEFRILVYTNRYMQGTQGVMSTMIFSNIKLEIGSTATPFTPYAFQSELEEAFVETFGGGTQSEIIVQSGDTVKVVKATATQAGEVLTL